MPNNYGLLSGEDAVNLGLGGAAGLIGAYTPAAYPGFVSSQTTGPSQAEYMNYTPNQPMAQIQTPNYQLNSATVATSPYSYDAWGPLSGPTYDKANTNAQAAGFNWQNTPLSMQNVSSQNAQAAPWAYKSIDAKANAADWNWNNLPDYQKFAGTTPQYQGLMGGDYNALQNALTTPGQIAAQDAYSQGYTNLNNTMGGRGLYGSSIMANQATQGLDKTYQNALATNAANAAATRYAQQAADLQNKNAFGLNVYGQQMGENQNMNQYGLTGGLAKNTAQLDYAGMQTDVNKFNVGNQYAQNAQLNALGLNYAGLQTGVNQQNAANSLQAQLANQSTNANLQGLLSQQGLAQNAAGLDVAQMQTGVNQQNVANALTQANQLNALRSGDTQQLQSLYNATNQQMNAQNLDYIKLATGVNQTNVANALTQNQNMNAYNLGAAQLGVQQNLNTYNAGAQDAASQNAYNLAALNYGNAGTKAQTDWANQQALEKLQYDLASGQYTNEQQTAMINQYLALAGRGQVTAGQNQAATTAANTADAASQAAFWQGIMGMIGTGAGIYAGTRP